MPTVTYKGIFMWRPAPGGLGTAERDKPIEVSQEWLDHNRIRLGPDWVVSGGEAPHVDEGNDGIPDPSWRVAEIKTWLTDNGVNIGSRYRTKTALLALVEEHLNPTPVEEAAEQTTME